MFKRYGFLTFLSVVTLILAACGGKSTPTEVPTAVPTATTAPTKVPTTAPTATPTALAVGPGDPAAGEQLFKSQTIDGNPGCGTCHSLKPDEVLVGPSMAGIATDAAGDAQEAGLTTEEMLHQMIVDPNAEIAGGFQPNIMPQNWGEKLTPQQLNDLIAYLMTLEE